MKRLGPSRAGSGIFFVSKDSSFSLGGLRFGEKDEEREREVENLKDNRKRER